MDLNKVSLIGTLASDPEEIELSCQKKTIIKVATNYNWRDKDTKEKRGRADYHRIIAFGSLAEIMHTYLKKGSKVYIDGRIQNRSWEDENHQKRFMTEIVATDIIMLGGSAKKTFTGDETAKEDIDTEEN